MLWNGIVYLIHCAKNKKESQAFVNVDWQISSVSISLAGVQMWQASRKEKQGERQSPTSSGYAGGGHRPFPPPHPFWLIFFWSPHLQAVIITGPYRGAVASGFILARDTTPPLVAVSRPLWVHELGVQSLEKLKLFNSARSQILLNVSSRIFFCKKLPSFWGWRAWQHLANIICSFFVYNFVKREQDMQKPWIVHTIHEKGMSKIVSDCFPPLLIETE